MYFTLAQTKLLFSSYVQYRFYLANVLNIKAAELVFHYPKQVIVGNSNYNVKTTINAYSEEVKDIMDALRYSTVFL